MLIVFGILIIIAAVLLGLIVLIQNPKGGGLSSTFGGFGNQLMGVKQTTDVLEKGTWILAAIVAVLCIISPVFVGTSESDILQETPTNVTAPKPQPNNANGGIPVIQDSNKPTP